MAVLTAHVDALLLNHTVSLNPCLCLCDFWESVTILDFHPRRAKDRFWGKGCGCIDGSLTLTLHAVALTVLVPGDSFPLIQLYRVTPRAFVSSFRGRPLSNRNVANSGLERGSEHGNASSEDDDKLFGAKKKKLCDYSFLKAHEDVRVPGQ